MTDRELDLNAHPSTSDSYYVLMDAIDQAAGQDQVTWLTEDGKRVAAIVPADVAYREEEVIVTDPATVSGFSRLGRMDRRTMLERRAAKEQGATRIHGE